MPTLLLILVTVAVSAQSVMKKAFQSRVTHSATFGFTGFSVLFSAIFFLCTSGGSLQFTPAIFGYSAFFAAVFCLASVTSFLAIATGPLSISSLILQLSLIIPTLYGLIAFNEEITPMLIAGITCLVLALVLVNLKGKEERGFSLKWLIFVALSFLGNGFCSVTQKAQQIAFDSAYKSEFMVVALLAVSVSMLVCSLFFERKQIAETAKKGFPFYLICGIMNGAANFGVLLLVNLVPASVMFPVISAGGIILTALIARFLYKEKLSRLQTLGFFLGIAAVIFLNL